MSFDTFQLRKLRLTGADGEKEIAFSSGLNVVSGPSNTGKSYILASIDFTFGAKSTPKPIEQSQLLTEVAVELHTAAVPEPLNAAGMAMAIFSYSPLQLN